MYAAHFGLSEPPFSITPDPRYLYMSEAHREALAHLLYGIGEGGGFVQLTGEVGTGKTTLCRCLLEQVPARVDVAFILNPKLTDVELLAAICDELRIAYPAGTTSRKVYVDALHHHLLDAHGRGHRTVLIIDEAQDLAPEVLEQIRLLTNLETTTQKLLQIILIGQPELIRLLEREDLRQLAQRVTARYHLRPFAENDTRAYVAHRLEVAGARERVFTETALGAVHHAARGIPRLINAVCDRALLGAYSKDQRRVDPSTVRRAAREVLGREVRLRRARPWRWAGALIAIALVAAASALLVGTRAGSLATSTAREATAPGSLTSPNARSDGAGPVSPPVDRALAAAPGKGTAGDPPAPLRVTEIDASSGDQAAPRRLAEILADPAVRSDKRSAFTSLYARWGLKFDGARTTLACERGRADGLQCLFKTGTWARLRRYNLPAIIELSTANGERRYATVVSIADNSARLDFGGQQYSMPFSEIDRHWEGPFIVLWKAPGLNTTLIGPGARGKDVEWLRQRLREVDGVASPGKERDAFDDALRGRVMAFQRARALVADGIVGEETLIHLVGTARDEATPRLSQGGS